MNGGIDFGVPRGSALACAVGSPVTPWVHPSSLCQGHLPAVPAGSAGWGHSLAGLAGQRAKAVSLPASPAQFRQDLKFTSPETLRRENRCSNTSSGGKEGSGRPGRCSRRSAQPMLFCAQHTDGTMVCLSVNSDTVQHKHSISLSLESFTSFLVTA